MRVVLIHALQRAQAANCRRQRQDQQTQRQVEQRLDQIDEAERWWVAYPRAWIQSSNRPREGAAIDDCSLWVDEQRDNLRLEDEGEQQCQHGGGDQVARD